jgi:hypothetical protein
MGNTRDTGYLRNLVVYDGSGNIVLPANLTVTGNIVGYATTSYVTTQINNLINGAPGLLDTLDELAAALGDDANFASTLTTSLSGKQASLSGTGFVKISGTTISYDNSTYLTTASASSTYLPLAGGTVTGFTTFYNANSYSDQARFGGGSNNRYLYTYVDNSGVGLATATNFGGESIYFNPVSNYIDFSVNSSSVTRIVNGGRVLIGNAYFADDTVNKLQVNGGARLTGALSGTSASFSSNVTVQTNLGFINTNASQAGFVADYTGAGAVKVSMSTYNDIFQVYNETTGYSIFNFKPSTKAFVINPTGGSVGIGVTDLGPDGLSLSTSFNYSWSEGSGNAYAVLFRQRNSAATVIASGYKRSNTGSFASSYGISMSRAAIAVGYNNGSIAFFSDSATNVANGTDTTPSERLTILNNGNIGLNVTSPTNLLHLAGSSLTPSLRLGSISSGFHYDIGRENQTTGDFLINATVSGVSQGTYLRIAQSSGAATFSNRIEITSNGGTNPVLAIRQTNAATQGYDFETEDVSVGRLDLYGVTSGGRVQMMTWIKSTGKVGIGTLSPVKKLDIISISEQLRIAYDASGTVYTDFRNDSAGGLLINTSNSYIINYIAGTPILRMNANGNVGIGSNPSFQLDVSPGVSSATLRVGSWAIMENVTTTQAMFGRNVAYATSIGSGWRNINTGGATAIRMYDDPGDPSIAFHLHASESAGTSLTSWDSTDVKMTIRNSGNVGIGTVLPGAKLTVQSTGATGILLEQDVSNSAVSSRLVARYNAGTGTIRYDTGGWRINTGATLDATSGTERALFSQDGYFRMLSGTGGIQFQGTTGAANALNYYEEGNWTPQLGWGSGSTYTMSGINSGKYVRIGSMVHLQFQLQWSSFSGSASSGLRVTGIPFTGGGTSRSAGSICANTGITLGSGYTWLGLTIDPGASFIYIIQNANSTYSHDPSVSTSGIVYSLQISYTIN